MASYPIRISRAPATTLAWALALVLALLPAGCADEQRAPAARDGAAASATAAAPVATPELVASDPGAPGRYPVGVIRRTLERTSSTAEARRPLDTVIWYPAAEGARAGVIDGRLRGVRDAAAAHGLFPVVIFSHGSGGYPEQSSFLTTYLAGHGFVVLAPPHPGNTVLDCFPCVSGPALRDSARNRPDDIGFVLDQLSGLNAEPGSPIRGLLDADRVGVAGHSFGGFTAVAAAARDTRFRAVLPMAPAVFPEVITAAARIVVPTLIMSADRDDITSTATAQQLYQALEAAPRRGLLTLHRGGHFSFADVCVPLTRGCLPGDLNHSRAQAIVKRFAAAFFLAYLAGNRGAAAALDPAAAGPEATLVTSGMP